MDEVKEIIYNIDLYVLKQKRRKLKKELSEIEYRRMRETVIDERTRLKNCVVEHEEELKRLEKEIQSIEQEQVYHIAPKGRLKIYAFQGGEIDDVIKFLYHLRNAYESLYVFDVISQEIQEYNKAERNFILSRIPISKIHDAISPSDKLIVDKVSIQSPGVWEVLGSWNPLAQLRDYLSERHERKKDNLWRNDLDRQEKWLKNMLLATQLMDQQVDLYKKANVGEEDIRKMILGYGYRSLQSLNSYQDKDMIGSAEITAIEESEEPSNVVQQTAPVESLTDQPEKSEQRKYSYVAPEKKVIHVGGH